MDPREHALDLVSRATRVVFFTGAGMSAESGLATFRDAQTGLWSNVDPQALANIDAWREDPSPIYPWYLWRLRLALDAEPHAGHVAIARWSEGLSQSGGWGRVVTQNIDGLHQRAGSAEIAQLHGSLTAFRCDTCSTPAATPKAPDSPQEKLGPPPCPHCQRGRIRPGVVWFGEALPEDEWNKAEDWMQAADLVVVVGTSGVVFPAAALPLAAARRGIPVIEISPEDTDLTPSATVSWRTTAARGLPLLAAAHGA